MKMNNPMQTLPVELVEEILCNLPWTCHEAAAQVCRLWKQILTSPRALRLRYFTTSDPLPIFGPRKDLYPRGSYYWPTVVDANPPTWPGIHRLLVGYGFLKVQVKGYDPALYLWEKGGSGEAGAADVKKPTTTFVRRKGGQEPENATVESIKWKTHERGLLETGQAAVFRVSGTSYYGIKDHIVNRIEGDNEEEEQEQEKQYDDKRIWKYDRSRSLMPDFYRNYLPRDNLRKPLAFEQPSSLMLFSDPIVSPDVPDEVAERIVRNLHFTIPERDYRGFAPYHTTDRYPEVRSLCLTRPTLGQFIQCLVKSIVSEDAKFQSSKENLAGGTGYGFSSPGGNDDDDDDNYDPDSHYGLAYHEHMGTSLCFMYRDYSITSKRAQEKEGFSIQVWGLRPLFTDDATT